MAARQRLICAASALIEAGPGIRFTVAGPAGNEAAFAIRWQGKARAYLNRCGHIPVELDWQPGEFFDIGRLYLICATHGALYDPATGACRGGRCQGRGLVPLPVYEQAGQVYLEEI
jgi:nitrite reductase/ring-hydroxylating ferredoxin subunit